MSLNQTPRGTRVHIAFFGRRNAGKSSLINAVTGQSLAIVSPVKGTTTDPVYKSMELLPLGPVVVIDTPGLDDEGELGLQRVEKARQVLNKADIAVLVIDGATGPTPEDKAIRDLVKNKSIPCLTVFTKSDLATGRHPATGPDTLWVSTENGENIGLLKERLAALAPAEEEKQLVADLVQPNDLVVLVTPIDAAAPKGRLILPQQQTIRDLLEAGAASVVVRETELENTLAALGQTPSLIITDSQAFKQVAAITPSHIPLTSFSILFARLKGDLAGAVAGAAALEKIQNGDKLLIAEGCTHHRQCGDIGTVKLPSWIEAFTGKKPEYAFTSGTEFPSDLSPYKLVIHCGGCMLNRREMQSRTAAAKAQGVPITNYGIAIAHTQGILRRSVELFPEVAAHLK